MFNIKKSVKKYSTRIAAGIMSLAVVVSVTTSLIKPAISLTVESELVEVVNVGADNVTADDFADFDQSSAVDLSSHITKVEGDGETPVDDDSVALKLKLNYALGDDAKNFEWLTESSTNKYVYYKLPSSISLTDTAEMIGSVTDTAYDNNIPAGYYYVKGDMLIIKFTDEYLQDSKTQQSGVLGGDVTIDATITRDDNFDQTDFTIDIGGQPLTVNGFTPKSLSFNKNGSFDSSTGQFNWAVNVTNTSNTDLNGYTVTDTMFDENTEVVAVDSSGNTVNVGSYDTATKKYIFNENAKNYTGLTLKYTTKLLQADALADNLVKNSWDEYASGEKENTATVTDTTSTQTDISKKVTYTTGVKISSKSASNDYNNKEIDWSINVEDKYGFGLDGYKISDDSFTADGVTFTLNEDNTIYIADGVYGTLVGNVMTITDTRTSPSNITINYSTPPSVTDGTKINNTANLSNDKTDFGNKTSETYYKPYTVGKTGAFDKTNNKVDWTINVAVDSTYTNGTLKDYEITDEMFASILDGTLSVEAGYILEGNKLTIKDDVKSVTIRYSTDIDTGLDNDKTTEETLAYINTANGTDGEYTTTTTATTSYTTKNTISKTYNIADVVISEDQNTVTIPWAVTMEQELGAFNGKTFTDTMSVTVVTDGDSATHTMSDSQFNDGAGVVLTYTKSDYSTGTLTQGADYTISYENGVMTVVFLDTELLSAVNKVVMNYSTTLDATGVTLGSSVSAKNSVSFNNKTSEPEYPYEKIDMSDIPYVKTCEDKESLSITDLKNLETVTVDGVDYYVFDWTISVVNGQKLAVGTNNYYELTDTMPAGFTLYGTPTYNYGEAWSTDYDMNSGFQGWGSSYGVAGSEVTFRIHDLNTNRTATIKYRTKVSVEDFKASAESSATNNETYTVSNSVQGGDYAEVTSSINVTLPDPSKGVVLDKTGEATIAPGFFNYSIEINEAGETLNGGKAMTLYDAIKNTLYQEYNGSKGKPNTADGNYSSSTAQDAFSISLDKIKLYEVDGDGNKTEISGWSYIFDNNPKLDTTETVSATETTAEYAKWYMFDNTANSTYSTTIECTAMSGKTVSAKYSYDDQWGNLQNVGSFNLTFDSKGIATVDIPLSYSKLAYSKVGIQISRDYSSGVNYDLQVYTVTAEKTTTTRENLAELTVTGIPDQKHLVLEYTYASSSDNEAVKYISALLSNSASLKGYTSSSDGTMYIKDFSSSSSYTNRYMALRKVDVGQNQLTLSAGFYLYKYDTEQGGWRPAKILAYNETYKYNEVAEWGDTGGTAEEIVTTANSLYNINLETGILYKLVENRNPTAMNDGTTSEEYISLTAPKYFAFISKPSVIPSDVNDSDISVVTSNSDYDIKNAKKISITVNKQWQDGVTTDRLSKVQLYRSTKLVTDGFPDDAYLELVENGEQEITDSYVWNDLTNGNGDTGKAYYYYVKEVSYSLDNGVTWINVDDTSAYQPIYTNNSTNGGVEGEGEIIITNASQLKVTKIWRDSTQSSHDEIEFTLYYMNAGNRVDLKTYNLNEGNSWTINIDTATAYPTLPAGTVFYVEETALSGYTVEYFGNGADSTGEIEIYNRPIEVAGAELPETGGMGTKMLTALGGLITFTAGATLVVKSKKKNNKIK